IAVELNVNRVMERVKQAIHERRKVYVRYRPDPQGPVETYQVAPLDVKPGKTPATRANDYLWVYSYEHESVISLRLGRVLGVELSEETFDPVELMADWKQKEPQWNVPREW
nr:WYL domain-containing protein [Anaerolineae bacterium]